MENGRSAELEHTTELFSRYSSGVYRYCLRRLGSREEAEDAVQVTYLNAWRSLKGGFEPDHHRPWLFQIAANVCATSLRSKLGGTRLELRDPATLDALVAHDKPAADDLLGLSDALRELPARQRRALVLRDWHGLSYNEIAAELAVSVASVETLLYRGRKRVAAALANADWRKVAPSARALLIWPFAFLRTKSVATSGGEHLKAGLALAGGTVAPLVAFGVIQGFLPGEKQPPQAARASPVVEVKAAQASGSWLAEGSLPHASLLNAGTQEAAGRRQPGSRKHTGASKGGKTQLPNTGSPPKTGPTAAASPSSKVTLCHGTGSNKNPGVTITVSGHASQGHRGDSPGAC